MKQRTPKLLWCFIIAWHIAVAIPFWRYSRPAPFFDVHGDVYRGWPWVYGLDQGDVRGDEWLFWVTYFQPREFAADTAVAVGCGLPVSLAAWLIWKWRNRVASARLAWFTQDDD